MPDAQDQRTRTAAPEAVYARALRADLERRIAELANTPDDAFGRIGLPDAILVAVLFVIVPALFAWLFR
jgi:hypothetical protein